MPIRRFERAGGLSIWIATVAVLVLTSAVLLRPSASATFTLEQSLGAPVETRTLTF